MTMKTTLTIFSILVLFGCTGRSSQNNAQKSQDSVNTEVVAPDMHNAKIALDFAGTYKGTLPCADCAGIETEIEISSDQSFVRKTRYLGKNGQTVFEEKGTYKWNDAGNTIIFNEVKDAPDQYFVGENVLIQLDLSGNRITGSLAEMYVLKKVL